MGGDPADDEQPDAEVLGGFAGGVEAAFGAFAEDGESDEYADGDAQAEGVEG